MFTLKEGQALSAVLPDSQDLPGQVDGQKIDITGTKEGFSAVAHDYRNLSDHRVQFGRGHAYQGLQLDDGIIAMAA